MSSADTRTSSVTAAADAAADSPAIASAPAREIARFGGVSVYAGGTDAAHADTAHAVERRSTNSIRLGGPGPYRVVVQKGRSFQRANPHVPVILDRGRYLVVELPSTTAIHEEPGCFAIADPDAGPVGFHVERAVPAARRGDIASILARLSADDLRARVEALVGLGTRHSELPRMEPALALTSQWLRDANCDVARVDLPIPGGTTANLIGKKSGTAGAPKLFVLCGHLDSVNHDGGPDAPAPGADDNGSGSATVAAIAQALADDALRDDVHFVLFGGEEQGLFGSTDYVARLSPQDRLRLGGVVNIDMAASRNTPELSVLLEGAPLSRPLINALAQAAATYTSLTTQVSLNPFASDHVPFLDEGLQAVLTIEGNDNAYAHEHTARDTPDRLDFELHREITAMNLAWLLEQAR